VKIRAMLGDPYGYTARKGEELENKLGSIGTEKIKYCVQL